MRFVRIFACLLAFSALAWGQQTFSLTSTPTFTCASEASVVGSVGVFKVSGPLTVPAGTTFMFSFSAPIVQAPVPTAGNFAVAFEGRDVTFVLRDPIDVPAGGEIRFNNAVLDLRNAAASTEVTVLANARPGVLYTTPTLARVSNIVSVTTSPTSLAMRGVTGGSSQQASGVGVLGPAGFSLSAITETGGAWLGVSAPSGNSFAVTANPASLAPGVYNGTVKVNYGATSCAALPVVFTVVRPVLASLPDTALGMRGVAGGQPFSDTISVFPAEAGSPNVDFTATVIAPGGPAGWLAVSPATGRSPAVITVTVNPAGMQPGTYTGTVRITSPATPNVIDVQIVVALTAPATLSAGARSLTFTVVVGTTTPAQLLEISNSGAGTINWTAFATTQSGGNWLSVSPATGGAPGTASVSVNATGLSIGSYQGTIRLVASGALNSPLDIPVTLNVVQSGRSRIGLSAATLGFSAAVGADPAARTIDVTNLGAGALGFTAAVATERGGNWLSVTPSTAVAPATLTVRVNSAALPQGLYTGTITIAALATANAENSPQVIQVTLAVGGPLVNRQGIVNGASFAPGGPISPGTIASVFGENFSTESFGATAVPLPSELRGVQVLVNNIPAPLFYVSPRQINFQVPVDLGGTEATVTVVTPAGRASGTVAVVTAVPGIFTVDATGRGQAAALNQDSTVNSAQNPARPGSVLQLFVTGLGATNPPLGTNRPGASVEPFNRTVITPTVMIGGVAAEVLFSGAAPGFVGAYQINARIPAATAAGDAVPVQVLLDGTAVSNTATVAVR